MTCPRSRSLLTCPLIGFFALLITVPSRGNDCCGPVAQEWVVAETNACVPSCAPVCETEVAPACESWTPAGTGGMSFDLNTMMTAQIQTLTSEVESLHAAAEETATAKQEMTDQLAALKAEHDELLAEKNRLAKSLKQAKDQAASDAKAAAAKQKKTQAALAQAKKQSQALQKKLADANAKSEQANQALVTIRKQQQKKKQKQQSDESSVDQQANRDDDAEGVEAASEDQGPKQDGDGKPSAPAAGGDEA